MQQTIKYKDPFQDNTPKSIDTLPDRDTGQTLQEQLQLVQSKDYVQQILDALPQMVMLLNNKKQLVLANHSLKAMLPGNMELLGKRPGEILNCIHALSSQQGCGSTSFCTYCGAFNALQSEDSQAGSHQECRLLRKKKQDTEALDLQVSSSVLHIQGQDFLLVYLQDISQEKRKQTLERVFFHDLLNSAGGIQSILELIHEEVQGKPQELTAVALHQARKIVDEIQAQKQVMAAENKTLELNLQQVYSRDVLRSLQATFANYAEAEGRNIELDEQSSHHALCTDPVLLNRVLGNMLKNALEASEKDQKVTLGAKAQDKEMVFWVHNPGHIPWETQMQIFKRSFSTKGQGRGLGTYSIKLLGEDYLQGKVWFSSDPEQGTTFYLSLPWAGDLY